MVDVYCDEYHGIFYVEMSPLAVESADIRMLTVLQP